ncbi:conserved hypothetical protein [Tenacibaculum ascidiaceicola]
MVFPKLTFDLISLSLLAIGTFAILINEPEKLLKRTKKIKLGSFELELEELNKEIKKVEESLFVKADKAIGLGSPSIRNNEETYQITDDYSMDLIRLSVEIEKTLRIIFEEHFKLSETRPLSIMIMVEKLREGNVIDYDTAKSLQKFWKLRNELIHNHKFEIKKKDFIAFNDIGIRVLKILKAFRMGFSDEEQKLPIYGLE